MVAGGKRPSPLLIFACIHNYNYLKNLEFVKERVMDFDYDYGRRPLMAGGPPLNQGYAPLGQHELEMQRARMEYLRMQRR